MSDEQSVFDAETILVEAERIARLTNLIAELESEIPQLVGRLRTARRRLKEAGWDRQHLLHQQAKRILAHRPEQGRPPQK